jgi:hypothetical protein
MNSLYYLTLPERIVRAAGAVVGGFTYEASLILLPDWVRQSRLYQAVIARLLRILIEFVGGVHGVLPPDDMDAKELTVRKTAGNIGELASFLAVGWSPLWLLAIAADLTGGTRIYLEALVSELKRSGSLSEDTDITSVAELLAGLEKTTGLMADTVDLPPLTGGDIRTNIGDIKSSWQALHHQVIDLPDADELEAIYSQLQQVADQEGRSLWSVSTLVGTGAVQAGIKMGQVHIFEYYRAVLPTILTEGLYPYSQRVARPYLAEMMCHFDTLRVTFTERLWRRVTKRVA